MAINPQLLTVAVGRTESKPELVEMWKSVIKKARTEIPPAAVRTTTMNFQWTGGGQALVLANTDPVILEVPFPARLLWAHMRAGDANGFPIPVTTTVDLQWSKFENWGAQNPVYGVGTPPSLSSASSNDCDTTSWHLDYTTGDTFVASLSSFSGVATWVALILLLRAVDAPLGQDSLIDVSSDTIIDSNGNVVVVR